MLPRAERGQALSSLCRAVRVHTIGREWVKVEMFRKKNGLGASPALFRVRTYSRGTQPHADQADAAHGAGPLGRPTGLPAFAARRQAKASSAPILAAAFAWMTACTGTVQDAPGKALTGTGENPSGPPGSAIATSPGSGSSGSMLTAGGTVETSGVPTGIASDAPNLAPTPTGVETDALIGKRIRRLSNAEYNASISALLGSALAPADKFAPDARQNGFTVNESQRVDPVLAKQLFTTAESVGADVASRVDEFAPCSTPNEQEQCAQRFIAQFGAQAYRRPLSDEEKAGLLAVFAVGAAEGSYSEGISLVVQAITQSASFLYLTELGDDTAAGDSVALTPYELASSLAYLVTGAPPDQELLSAAENGQLSTPEGRLAEMERLAVAGHTVERIVRIVREWLELDRITATDKDSQVYPRFNEFKEAVIAESYSFVRAVVDPAAQVSGSDVATLLGANWTVAEPGLGQFYPDAEDLGNGYLSLEKRRGILNQGAFLSVKAHAHESSPVLRGVLVARRVACIAIPAPASLNIDIVPPVPDPTQTTRQRFEVHTQDTQCASCHTTIDGFGNAFEQYDGMGMFRDTENGLPVDATTTVEVNMDFDANYNDSNEMAVALANSAVVRQCFARHIFNAAAASSGAEVAEAERAFLAAWQQLSPEDQGNVFETLAAFVQSPLFTHRRSTP